jgi:hypothetical protein
MKCAYCGSSIGMVRQFRDSEYCSDEHHRLMVARSSRVARDDTRFYEWDEPWAPLAVTTVNRQTKPHKSIDMVTTVAMTILFLILLFAGATTSLPGLPSPPAFKKVGELNAAPQTISAWTALPVAGGNLRLWPESVGYSHYRFSFKAVLDNSPLGWAVRATDPKNYLAMRLVHGSDGYRLQRSAVIGGIEGERMATGLLAGLQANSVVTISVESREQAVITQVNGKTVDSWSDPRLTSGGAGLLSARAHDARVESVHLTLLDRRSPVEIGYWYLPGTYLGPAVR